MGLESATYIDDLDPSWPLSGDDVNQGDDHIRLTKQVLQNQFPNLNAAVNPTPIELNYLVGVTSSIQTQLNEGVTPVGGIIMYNGTFASIPSNWQLCDGTNGTPDLTDKFVYGTNTELELGDEGGSADAVVVAHTHTAQNAGDHDHDYNDPGHTHYNNTTASDGPTQYAARGNSVLESGFNSNTAVTGITHNTDGDHTHTIDSAGVSGTNQNLPPYYKLAFIRRMS